MHVTNIKILVSCFGLACNIKYEQALNILCKNDILTNSLLNNNATALVLTQIPFIKNLFFSGHHLISIAAKKGYLDVVNALIKLGIDLNDSSDGFPPLYYAIHSQQQEIISTLIAAGADITLTVKGIPLVMLMLFEGHSNLFAILSSVDFNCSMTVTATELIKCVRASKMPNKIAPDLLENLLIGVNQLNDVTLLHVAMLNGDLDTVKMLIKKKTSMTDFNNLSVVELAQNLRLNTIAAYLKSYLVYLEFPINIPRKLALQKLSSISNILELDEKLKLVKKIDKSYKYTLKKLNELNLQQIYLDDNLFSLREKYQQLYLAVCTNTFEVALEEMRSDIMKLNLLYEQSKKINIRPVQTNFFLPEPLETYTPISYVKLPEINR